MPRLVFGFVAIVAVVPGAAQPPMPVPAARVLDLARHDVHFVPNATFTPDGSVVAVRGEKYANMQVEYVLTLWDAATGRHLRTYRGADAGDDRWCFSPDGRLLALPAEARAEVVVREVASGKVVHRLAHPLADTAALSPDGKHLVTHTTIGNGIDGRALAVWEVATGKRRFHTPTPTADGFDWARYTTDGRLLFDPRPERMRVWDPATGAEGPPVKFAGNPTDCPLPSRDGRWFMGVAAGRPRLHDQTGAVVRTFGRPEERFDYADFSPNATRVVAYTKSGRVVQWDTATGAERATFTVPDVAGDFGPHLRFTADARYLVASWSQPVAGETVTDPAAAVYSADGRLLRRDLNVWHIEFDPASRSVVVVRRTVNAAGGVVGFDVTIHDAAEWLAGRSR